LYQEMKGPTNGIASTSRPISRKSIIDQRPGNAGRGVCGTFRGSTVIVTQPPTAQCERPFTPPARKCRAVRRCAS
jgi:hypothetical protein